MTKVDGIIEERVAEVIYVYSCGALIPAEIIHAGENHIDAILEIFRHDLTLVIEDKGIRGMALRLYRHFISIAYKNLPLIYTEEYPKYSQCYEDYDESLHKMGKELKSLIENKVKYLKRERNWTEVGKLINKRREEAESALRKSLFAIPDGGKNK